MLSHPVMRVALHLTACHYPKLCSLGAIRTPSTKLTVSPFLTPVASRNLLLYQSLPTHMPYREAKVRRRKDDTSVGTAARGNVERLSCVPRRLHADGGASGRVRGALSTGAGDQSRPAPHASLPPGAAVPRGPQECRGHRCLRRCRATDHPRLHRHSALGSSALGDCVSRTSGRAVGRTRGHDRLRSQQLPQARHPFGGGEAPVVWPPGEGRQLPDRRLHGLCLATRPCLSRLSLG